MKHCASRKPFKIVASRVSKSPFARGRSLDEALVSVKRALAKVDRGESIGFTFTSSLKSMGLVARSSGVFMLGPKYC